MKVTAKCPVCGTVFTRICTAGKPPKHCSRACANRAPGRMTSEVREKIGRAFTGKANPKWIDGSWTLSDGRTYIWVPKAERHLHPSIRPDGYIRRYHHVWNTAHPDDPVRSGEIIHHLNHDLTDDRIENLKKWNQSEHATYHGTGRFHTPEALEKMRQVQQARRKREREAKADAA